jgi:hypothetical protein
LADHWDDALQQEQQPDMPVTFDEVGVRGVVAHA